MRQNPLTESETPVVTLRYSRDPWLIVQCQETGMVFLANPPEYSQLEDEFAWEKTYAAEKERRKRKEPVFSALSSAVKKVRRILRPKERIETLSVSLLRHHPGRPKLVDVGCGLGDKAAAVATHLKEHFQIEAVPVGIEISMGLAAEADANLKPFGGHCIQASALAGIESIEDGSADLIILCSFLEHEVNPLPLLRGCQQKLHPEGRVVIKVPNFNSVNRWTRQQRWCGFRYPDHVNYFTPATLREAIERAGLRVVRMNFFDRLPTSDNLWAIAGKKP